MGWRSSRWNYYIESKISPFTIEGNLAVRLGEATSTYAYTVTPIDSYGCQESTSGSLVVKASNSVIAISSTPPTICNGEAINYFILSAIQLSSPLT